MSPLMAFVYVVDQKLLHRIKRFVCVLPKYNGRTSLLEK